MKNIAKLEEQLTDAMLTSNYHKLDELLADDLLFTNHLGQPVTKAEDIALHKAGLLKIKLLEKIEETIKTHKNAIVVSVLVDLTGTYEGQNASGKFRFTRVWAETSPQKWQVIAGHSSLLSE
jgi:hypothetical protein